MTRQLVACFAAAILTFTGTAWAGERDLTRFDGKDSLRWDTVNDGVMGGRSLGGPKRTENNTLLFAGRISLENNGGFSSVRTRSQDLKLGNADGLEIRVRGDGRAYKLALRTKNASRWISYWADFATRDGEWTTVRIPFTKWAPYTFGRRLAGPRLSPAAINSVGFMLYDKKAGPFSLEVDSIRAYEGDVKADAKAKSGGTPSIVETARAAGNFKTLLAAARAAGLVEALSGTDNLTVFAPSDEAFARLPKGTVEKLLQPENRKSLRTILLHHVVKGDASLPALLKSRQMTSLSGQRLSIVRDGAAIRVGGSTVTTAEIRCENGVIHVVDEVILPEQRDLVTIAREAKIFQTLVTAVGAAGLADALAGVEPLTVFAPSDAAFARLPEGTLEFLLRPENRESLKRILLHHVVKGRVFADAAAAAGTTTTLAGTRLRFGYSAGLTVNKTRILTPDVTARNGVIHIVDSVLLPPPAKAEAEAEVEAKRDPAAGGADRAKSVIELAIDAGVDLYNGGNAESCRRVYERAAKLLLDMRESPFSARVKKQLEDAIASTESAKEKAWTLRRALDAAYAEADRTR